MQKEIKRNGREETLSFGAARISSFRRDEYREIHLSREIQVRIQKKSTIDRDHYI